MSNTKVFSSNLFGKTTQRIVSRLLLFGNLPVATALVAGSMGPPPDVLWSTTEAKTQPCPQYPFSLHPSVATQEYRQKPYLD